MTQSIQPLSFEKHSQIKIKNVTNYIHAKEQQVVPLIVQEFFAASAEMPIVFVKNAENGAFQSVALLGFKPQENVFYSEEKWLGGYLPALITHHPFALAPTQNDDNQLQVIIKEDSHLVSSQEGDALFEADGQETDYMKKRKSALGQYFEHTRTTRAFIASLTGYNLLEQQKLTIDLNGDKIVLDGVYLINEKKLNELSNEDFLILRQRGYLAPIYSHLNSLRQLSKLAALKTQ
jgi:hypothetical protein